MRHLLTLARSVRVGGLSLGPLRAGGRTYTVATLSVLRFLQVLQACAEARGAGLELLQREPEAFVRCLAPLLVLEDMRPADLRRMSRAQAAALWEALETVNDWPFLMDQLRSRGPEEAAGGAGGEDQDPDQDQLLDLVDLYCELRPANTVEDVKRMPAQLFFAQLDIIARRAQERRDAADPDGGWETMSTSDLAAFAGHDSGVACG